jgi:hypothetical protein
MPKKMNKGTNLEKLKQAFDASKGSGGGNINWWRPQWGDNLVRILPPIDEEDVFFHETARHRINGEWYYCLKHKKDPETGRSMSCPICEVRKRLFRSGEQDLIGVAKDIKPRKQYLMNIVDRKSDDDTQVFVYAAGVKIWNKMVSTMLDDDIDITDVEEGYDFLIKKEEGPKTENGQFPTYDNSKAKRKSSPLHEDEEKAKEILKNRNELKDIPTFDEQEVLQSAVDSYIQSLTSSPNEDFYGDDNESEDESEEKESSSNKSSKANIDKFKRKLKAQLDSDDDD